MEFGVDIKKLSDIDLERYKSFLFDHLLGIVQSDTRRMKLIDRIEEVNAEVSARQGDNNARM